MQQSRHGILKVTGSFSILLFWVSCPNNPSDYLPSISCKLLWHHLDLLQTGLESGWKSGNGSSIWLEIESIRWLEVTAFSFEVPLNLWAITEQKLYIAFIRCRSFHQTFKNPLSPTSSPQAIVHILKSYCELHWSCFIALFHRGQQLKLGNLQNSLGWSLSCPPL